VLVVREAVTAAAARARGGEGATVIEALTYRHFGHSRTDPATYRPAGEVEEWLRRDPLLVTREQLVAMGVESAEVDSADERAAALVSAASDAAQAAPDADPAEALTDVWADGGAAWRT
jgi:acetoin:2,6-dichlorophenolindophenol oxidoreductase subunit alpha